jgi:hypothetical protein
MFVLYGCSSSAHEGDVVSRYSKAEKVGEDIVSLRVGVFRYEFDNGVECYVADMGSSGVGIDCNWSLE